MEKDPGYLVKLFSLAWDAAEMGAVVIDLFLALILVCVIRYLEKKHKLPPILLPITKHKLLEDDKFRLVVTFGIIFIMQMVFISPYSLYTKNRQTISELKEALDDKSPKLVGSVDQFMINNEPGTTNTIMIPQLSINNRGFSDSAARHFNLKVILGTNTPINAKPIDISDYYGWQTLKGDTITVFRLYRAELLSEKTYHEISHGFAPRGWLAYRLPFLLDISQNTNAYFIVSFIDSDSKEVFVTNGFQNGKFATNMESIDIPRTLAGSVNLVYTNYQLPSVVAGGWQPPELPPGCTEVAVILGTRVFSYPRFLANVSSQNGTKFAIKDLPDYLWSAVETNADYSPRLKEMWVKGFVGLTFGDKTIPYPIQPVVVSNRLYIEMEMPFSNEKRKLVMNDSFDPELPIPKSWDRNFSTNYDAMGGIYIYEVVNELRNPVLQVVYSAPNVIHVNGIFQVGSNTMLAAFGEDPKLFEMQFTNVDVTVGTMTASLSIENFHETITIGSNETIASFGQRLTNEFFRPIFKNQKAIFKYPSNRNPGAFAGWLTETNKGDTK